MKTEKEIEEMIEYMEIGLEKGTHQATDAEVESGIRCLRWVLTD